VARGLPTKVYEDPRQSQELTWGLKSMEKVVETKAASIVLQPGTAVNVTIKGNYTKTEAPYTADLVAYFADNSDSVTRKITAMVS
jgi:hypothetical protein